MKKKPTIIVLTVTALAACTTNPVTNNLEGIKRQIIDAQKSQVLGVLEVELSNKQGTLSSAKFIAANAGGLSAKGVAVPINSSNWTFTPGDTKFVEDANFKYVQNTFALENKTTTGFQNLVMYALNTPTNLGGTAFSVIKYLDNLQPLPLDPAISVARAMMPTHGNIFNTTTVDPNKADLMIYTPAEATAVQAQLVAPGFTISNPTVLEYGFVARNLAGGGRAIGPYINANTTTQSCGNTNDPTCNKGMITWAFKFPKTLPNYSNLGKFTLKYLVVNEPGNFKVQSLEEQTVNTVAGNSSSAFFDNSTTTVRALIGTKYHLNDLQLLSQVKTATSTASQPAAYIPITAQVTTSGQLDNYFGANGGRLLHPWGSSNPFSNDFGTAIAVQADGKILALDKDVGVTRLNTDGTLDSSFGTGGMTSIQLPTGLYNPNFLAIALQHDGKMVVAGSVTASFSGSRFFVVARLTSSGALDTSFSADGITAEKESAGDWYGRAVAITGTGTTTRIVVAGTAQVGDFEQDFAVARFNEDGSRDLTLNPSGSRPGLIRIDLSSTALNKDDEAHAIVIQPDDKIILAGSTGRFVSFDANASKSALALVRLNPDGSLDSSFGTGGKVITSLGQSSADGAGFKAVKLLANGSILASGNALTNYPTPYPTNPILQGYVLAKYTSIGLLDSSFGVPSTLPGVPAGVVFASFEPSTNFPNNELADFAVLSNGSIVVAGRKGSAPGTKNTGLAKYTSAGILVSNFSTDVFGFAYDDEATGIAVGPDEKIITVGYGNGPNLNSSRLAVARFNP
jgi:uncharacterized delta-60 repeat protein